MNPRAKNNLRTPPAQWVECLDCQGRCGVTTDPEVGFITCERCRGQGAVITPARGVDDLEFALQALWWLLDNNAHDQVPHGLQQWIEELKAFQHEEQMRRQEGRE